MERYFSRFYYYKSFKIKGKYVFKKANSVLFHKQSFRTVVDLVTVQLHSPFPREVFQPIHFRAFNYFNAHCLFPFTRILEKIL